MKPEVFFEESLKNDIIKNNGKISPWQSGLLNSIHRTYKTAETTFEEVKSNKTSLPNIRQKFCDTGNQRLYNIGYRTKCHNIHRDWVDFTQNYLNFDEKSGSFSPNFNEQNADIRQLNPVLMICCNALIKFINDFPDHGISKDLGKEIEDDQKIIFSLEEMHSNFLNNKDLLDGIDMSKFFF